MIDLREISTGREIPTELYSDQPYVVKTADGAWLCVVTTGYGLEGEAGQHIVTTRSMDLGRNWSRLVDVEPADGPEASYAVPLVVPGGRIYIFYNHNSDNLRQVLADDPPFAGGWCSRVDSQGYFVFKYSDNNGQTWSERRYPIPVREMEIDRQNPYQGRVRYFWNVGKPFIHAGSVFVPLHKVGGLGHGFFTRSEGVLLRSPNLLVEKDAEKITWETLPDGDAGLRTPPGGEPIAEEQSFVALSDGSFFCVYRTIDGHPCSAYSRDGGRTWTTPQYLTFADGRQIKHPRAANFVWKCSNGKYLYWFHNHGGRWYDDRNPVWLCGGVEAESPAGKVIRWSQPEIVLYHDDPFIRISYPDLIEDQGKIFLTETQKVTARVHEVAPELLAGLWSQFDTGETLVEDGLVVSLEKTQSPLPDKVNLPVLPAFCERDNQRSDMGRKDTRQGITLELLLRFRSLIPGQVVLDNRTDDGRGFALVTTDKGTLALSIQDGRTGCVWDCDPGVLRLNTWHHIGVIIDGGPKIILFVVDGKVCDGGVYRQYGWGRFSPNLMDMNGSEQLLLAPTLQGEIKKVSIYQRALRVSEIIQNNKLF